MAADTLLQTLVALERTALDRWARGDTGGYAALLGGDATYFDHATRQRLHGAPVIAAHMRAFDGKISIPRHDIVEPTVHHDGSMAVLAFNWDCYGADDRLMMRWNATSVYGRADAAWRIIHTHWSIAAKD